MKNKHTPTPWRVSAKGLICTEDLQTVIAQPPNYSQDFSMDAAYIVKAVNAHEELVKMLKTVYREGAGRHYEAISELIAKVEGE